MHHPIFRPALLLGLLASAPASATWMHCTQPDGIPLYTDSVPIPANQCQPYTPDPMGLSVNAQPQPEVSSAARTVRTQREIRRAQAARETIQNQAQEKRRSCSRARTRAAAAWTLPLRQRAALNRASFYACQ